MTSSKAFIIGSPIDHSLSPKLHEYWLKQYGIDGSYEAINVPPEYLVKTVKALREKGFIGGNVTIPHKEKVMMLCDDVDQTALAVGAVNTLKFEHGKIKGYNTDVYGFSENLKTGGADFSIIKSALILGAGGAARAVIIALMKNNIKVTITNRTQAHAEKLCGEFKCHMIPWAEEEKRLGEFHLVINTTSLGMKGNDPLEIDLSNLGAEAVVNDIVYNPLETAFLKHARDLGLKTVDGLGMLLYQAVEGFEMWFGQKPGHPGIKKTYIIMPVIGLTGNIASGKSHIAEIFGNLGALVYNADIAAHEIMESVAFKDVAASFPDAIEDGKISRKKLGEIVFHDEEKLVRLEQILHPPTRKKNLEFIAANKGKLLVLEIPLLYETDAHEICDATVFVNVSRETQLSRALSRPGLDPQKLEKIIARQTRIPIAEKLRRADFVIHNEPGVDLTAEVKKIIHSISA